MPITEPIDEDELEADLAALEQENLDARMIDTKPIPQDQLSRLPQAANGERKFHALSSCVRVGGRRRGERYWGFG